MPDPPSPVGSAGFPVGYNSMMRAVKKAYPLLSLDEVTNMTNILLEEIAKRIESGQIVAFLKTNRNGDPELTTIGIEVLKKKVKKR